MLRNSQKRNIDISTSSSGFESVVAALAPPSSLPVVTPLTDLLEYQSLEDAYLTEPLEAITHL